MIDLKGKTVVITGGTGSLGKVLTRRLLGLATGRPAKIIVFSRDEAKQHFMRLEYQKKKNATDEVIYHNFEQVLEFRIGDVRDYSSVCSVLKGADVVVNAAALKQVPSCEYFPVEAVMTNVLGVQNIVRAIRDLDLRIETVVGVSTDKACKPVNVMGMTKALQERVFIAANLATPATRFICVRYGNVLASRGSVIPLFHEQIGAGGPLTITTEEMTRFLLPLDRAVTTILDAIAHGERGDTFVPKVPAARIVDVARALIDGREIRIVYTGIRPGEKIHEVLVSEEEGWRTYEQGDYYVIKPMLPELAGKKVASEPLRREYNSGAALLNLRETRDLLEENRLLVGRAIEVDGELLQ